MTVEHVTFDAGGVTLAGLLYRPDNPPADLPAVVVSGSWTSVKEQMAGLYAQRLAAQGFVTLAFDFTGYGESGGDPRDVESPSRKNRDLQYAVTFLSGVAGVDAQRIGTLGICAEGGFAAVHAADDPRVNSLVMVAAGLQDGEFARMALGGEESFLQHVTVGQKALAHYAETGEVEYVPAVSDTDPTAAMYGPYTYYLDPARGGIPQYGNRFALMAWAEWLAFEPGASADRITVPTLSMHSETAAIPDGIRRFAARLHAPLQTVWLDGRTQFDFYDDEPTVTESIDHAARHLHATL